MHSLSRCMQFSFILPVKLTDTQGLWIVVCIYSGIAQKEEFVLCFGIKVCFIAGSNVYILSSLFMLSHASSLYIPRAHSSIPV